MSELGHLAIRFGLAFALLGFGAGIFAGVKKRADWARLADRAVWLVFACVSAAMGFLFWAFATNDFQLSFVAQHSARGMPLHYRLAALWGGQSGSLLLWLWMLMAYSAACVYVHRSSNRSLMPWVSAILLSNAIFFLVLVNFVTDPFEVLPPDHVMSDGNGLNPLLQHPVMMIHPLMLYTGFVGFAVPFAFGFAALITGELGSDWFRVTRRWTLVPWFFLAIGIMLGGRWAYEVLGWGGYWAWDPVENASLMPWLAATAYLHSVMIQEKRDMLKIWNLALIGLTYSLCLFGTFLTRSGVVQSVHSFTAAGYFGYIFLGYLVVFASAFFAALMVRRSSLRSTSRIESVVSREASFLANNWAFMVLLFIVFWGTMFPVFSEWLGARRITVSAPWFNVMAVPVGLILLFLTGVGPLVAWRRSSLSNLRRQFVVPVASGVATGVVVALWTGGTASFYALVAWILSGFVVATIVQEYARAIGSRRRAHGESFAGAFGALLRKNQRRYGGYIVHLGVVFIFIGIAGAAFNEERLETLSPGGEVRVSDYRLQYLTARPIPQQHYGGAVARLALFKNDEPLSVLAPEKRMYWLEQQPSSIPAIRSTIREDFYVILQAIEANGAATLKIYRNPLVNWIWIGGYTFVLGAIFVLWPHPQRATPNPG